MKLVWKAQNTFDEAHALHRSTYDIYVSDLSDKAGVLRKVLAFYRECLRDYGETAGSQATGQLPVLQSVPAKVSALQCDDLGIHYLQVAVYDPLAAAQNLEAKQKVVEPILRRYHEFLEQPPVNGHSCL